MVGLTAACFLVTAALLLRVHVPESEPEPDEGEGFLRSALAGFSHIARTPVLARTTILIGVAFAATGLLNVAAFPVIEQGCRCRPRRSACSSACRASAPWRAARPPRP